MAHPLLNERSAQTYSYLFNRMQKLFYLNLNFAFKRCTTGTELYITHQVMQTKIALQIGANKKHTIM